MPVERGTLSLCSHQDGDDGPVVTGLVEVFQVEGVVPHLVYVRPVESRLPGLEFYREHHSVQKEDNVDALPETGDVVFEDDLPSAPEAVAAGDCVQSLFHDPDFLLPRLPLGERDVELAVLRQLLKNSFVQEKIIYG